MLWVTGVLGAALVAVFLLSERQARRDREDLMRPGLPALRRQQRLGVGHLGEAPVTIHHRLGGRGRG
jgi:hypothetical protein